jgi:hypothetical protein
MTTELVPASAQSVQRMDSLSANEFAVYLEEMPLRGVLRVMEFKPFKLDVKPTTALKALKDPFKLVRLVESDPASPVNKWLVESVNAQADFDRPRRDLTLVAVDEGVPTRQWLITGAWISEASYSSFDSSSREFVEETLTIQWEAIKFEWL